MLFIITPLGLKAGYVSPTPRTRERQATENVAAGCATSGSVRARRRRARPRDLVGSRARSSGKRPERAPAALLDLAADHLRSVDPLGPERVVTATEQAKIRLVVAAEDREGPRVLDLEPRMLRAAASGGAHVLAPLARAVEDPLLHGRPHPARGRRPGSVRRSSPRCGGGASAGAARGAPPTRPRGTPGHPAKVALGPPSP